MIQNILLLHKNSYFLKKKTFSKHLRNYIHNGDMAIYELFSEMQLKREFYTIIKKLLNYYSFMMRQQKT